MPLVYMDSNVIRQECAACGYQRTLPLFRAFACSRPGPFALGTDAVLHARLDGTRLLKIVLQPRAFADPDNVSAVALVGYLDALMRDAAVFADGDSICLESASGEPQSASVEVWGHGAALLGFRSGAGLPLRLGALRRGGGHVQRAVNTIELPPCSRCAAVENLLRTWDRVPADYAMSYHAQHKRAVNALSEYLKVRGYIEPEHSAGYRAEAGRTPEIDARYPHEPITLPSIRA